MSWTLIPARTHRWAASAADSPPDATIVTVSSGLAFAPLKITPSYNASKAAPAGARPPFSAVMEIR
jgi:hypothetical protein